MIRLLIFFWFNIINYFIFCKLNYRHFFLNYLKMNHFLLILIISLYFNYKYHVVRYFHTQSVIYITKIHILLELINSLYFFANFLNILFVKFP